MSVDKLWTVASLASNLRNSHPLINEEADKGVPEAVWTLAWCVSLEDPPAPVVKRRLWPGFAAMGGEYGHLARFQRKAELAQIRSKRSEEADRPSSRTNLLGRPARSPRDTPRTRHAPARLGLG